MYLYSASLEQFIHDATMGNIAGRLTAAYKEKLHRNPIPGEVKAWENSSRALKDVLEKADLNDIRVVLELRMPYNPYTSRADCLLMGRDKNGLPHIIIVELKGWLATRMAISEDGDFLFKKNGKLEREPHPIQQVNGYRDSLRKYFQFLHAYPEIILNPCVYCHGYRKQAGEGLFDPQFEEILKDFPLFCAETEEFERFTAYLKALLSGGCGDGIYELFKSSDILPNEGFSDAAGAAIKGQQAFILMDDQITIKNLVTNKFKEKYRNKSKSVIIVEGGPGTGKSVIAFNLLADARANNMKVSHATGTKSFTETIRKITGNKNDFRYFNYENYHPNSLDLLICDEAHRLRRQSGPNPLQQIQTLIGTAHVTVFFIDPNQVHRPHEIGTVKIIKEAANSMDTPVLCFEQKLEHQFRCNGSDTYINWLSAMLQINCRTDTPPPLDPLDYKITTVDSPEELQRIINDKNKESPNTARMVAPFCWPWSKPRSDGTLVNDIRIGSSFSMPWENSTDQYLGTGIPPWFLWAYDPLGATQVGTIYTVQGFEFKNIGIIWGKEFTYDPTTNDWKFNPDLLADYAHKDFSGDSLDLMKHIYYTFLTRATENCFVYFMDQNTRDYFERQLSR